MYQTIILSLILFLSILFIFDKKKYIVVKESYKNTDDDIKIPYYSNELQNKGYEDYGPLTNHMNIENVSQCMYNSEGAILCGDNTISPLNISYWEEKNKNRQLNIWGDN